MTASFYVRANGIDIHFLRDGRGPLLVLLHGWQEFCRVWEPVISALRDRFELFAPDLRGVGDTTKPYAGPTEEMTSQVLAGDLEAFIDALDLNRPVGLCRMMWVRSPDCRAGAGRQQVRSQSAPTSGT
jgi:pimeloyl-ACP methyl ester carboxylesterase